MPTLDIPLPAALTKAMETPRCVDFSLPKANFPELRLPTGGTIKGIADITKGIPSDCSMNVSLALQIAPIMASMECLLKVLKFLGVLISTFKDLSGGDPFAIPAGLLKIADAGEEVAECILKVVAPAIPFGQFVKDLLLMIAKMIKCLTQSLKSVVDLLDGLELEISSAAQNGNDALAAQLQCAKENGMTAANASMQAIDPIATILTLAKPFFDLMPGAPKIALPQLASDGSLDSLKTVITTLEDVSNTIEAIAKAIPL